MCEINVSLQPTGISVAGCRASCDRGSSLCPLSGPQRQRCDWAGMTSRTFQSVGLCVQAHGFVFPHVVAPSRFFLLWETRLLVQLSATHLRAFPPGA